MKDFSECGHTIYYPVLVRFERELTSSGKLYYQKKVSLVVMYQYAEVIY